MSVAETIKLIRDGTYKGSTRETKKKNERRNEVRESGTGLEGRTRGQ